MAHPNEREYLRQFLSEWPTTDWPDALKTGRILEAGSARYGQDVEYQTLFPLHDWLGVDLAAERGVDLVCDLTGDCAALGDEQFPGMLCCSVLEHCTRPWLMAERLAERLKPEGFLYVTVPWIWRSHAYPHDYWRMSVAGVRELFPTIHWKRISYATQADGEFITEQQAAAIGPPLRQIQGSRVYLCSQFICMIGRKVHA